MAKDERSGLYYWPEISPQGRSKIYFCAHPKDFRKYFDSIRQEILRFQPNSTIFYCKDGKPNDFSPVRQEMLSEMQMFVMPVSADLLETRNTALRREFPLAVSHRIPVLPILTGRNLEERFNQKCGKLQCLDRTGVDLTAIPYEEKLRHYLASTLVGDDMIRQIQSAFDASIFLSYRKKDRREARELMKQIHRCSSCRDVGIWFDEYLVPGEEFEGGIQTALRSCHLFVMLVTRNLLNEPNYVQEVEYPDAKKQKKMILPVEAVDPDLRLPKIPGPGEHSLAEWYEELPPLVSNRRELSNRLLAALAKRPLRRHSGEPRHDFLIGMAYLKGINMETDHEKALELITQSARNGLPEACEKLVSMYHSGDGVKRSQEEAIVWQQKLKTLLFIRWKKDPSVQTAARFFQALWDLSEDLLEVGRIPEARDTVLEMKDITEQLCWEYPMSEKARLAMAAAHHQMGRIDQAEGLLREAEQEYLSDLKIREQLVLEKGSAEGLRGLPAGLHDLGDIAMAQGRLPDAEGYYRRALEAGERLARQTQNPSARWAVAESYCRLARLSQACKDWPAALDFYQKNQQTLQQLAEETQQAQFRRALAECCMEQGDIFSHLGKVGRAKEFYEAGLELCQELTDRENMLEAAQALAECHRRLADLLREEGSLLEAEDHERRSLRISTRLSKETDSLRVHQERADGLCSLAQTLLRAGRLTEAKQCANQAITVCTMLEKSFPSTHTSGYTASAGFILAQIQWAGKDLEHAQISASRAMAIREKISKEIGTEKSRLLLADSCCQMGDIVRDKGEQRLAGSFYSRGLNIVEQLTAENCSLSVRRRLSALNRRLGDLDYVRRNLQKAEDRYQTSITLSRQLFQEGSTASARRELSTGFDKMGDVAATRGRRQDALDYYLRSLSIRQELVKEQGAVEDRFDLSRSYYNLTVIVAADRKREEAIDYCSQGIAILKDLCRETELQQIRDYLNILTENLANLQSDGT